MDVKVKAGVIAAELSLLAGITARKPTIPELSYVLIETEMGGLKLTATDLDVTLRSSCPAEVVSPGSMLLPARRLAELSKLWADDMVIQITAGTKGDGRIKAGDYDGRMQVLDPKGFPTIADVPSSAVTMFKNKALAEMLSQVAPCIKADNRYQTDGVSLAVKAGKATSVATDGHRLGLSVTDVDVASPDSDVIIPSKAMAGIQSLLSDEGECAFVSGENHLFFSAGDRLLMSRVIEGKFPEYQRMIPKNNDTVAVVDRDKLAQAMRRVAVIKTDESASVRVRVEKDAIVISAVGAEVGDATERVLAEVTGEPVESAYRLQYLMDFLGGATPGNVSLEMKSDKMPGLFVQLGDGPTKYRMVVMPMMV